MNFSVSAYNYTYLNDIFYYDDFYEALTNTNINDFVSFLISYYMINSFNLILLGFIILIISIVCVNLNKFTKITRVQHTSEFLNIFDFFKSIVAFNIIRQQNLVDQEASTPSSRIFKKKLNL